MCLDACSFIQHSLQIAQEIARYVARFWSIVVCTRLPYSYRYISYVILCVFLPQKSHWKEHKKVCSTLNKGRAQQMNHPGHIENSNQRDHDSMEKVSELMYFSLECQELFRLFMSTPKKEEERELNARVRTMKKIAKKIPMNERIAFLHHVLIIMVRVKSWRLEKPTSLVLILLQSGVDPDCLFRDFETRYEETPHAFTCLSALAVRFQHCFRHNSLK